MDKLGKSIVQVDIHLIILMKSNVQVYIYLIKLMKSIVQVYIHFIKTDEVDCTGLSTLD